jgi:hypothetical protein
MEDSDKKTKEIDEIIQPYYQKAELDYQKEKNEIDVGYWYFLLIIIGIIWGVCDFINAKYINPDNYTSEYQYGEERSASWSSSPYGD